MHLIWFRIHSQPCKYPNTFLHHSCNPPNLKTQFAHRKKKLFYPVHFISRAYRYCRYGRLPSCGTKFPDKPAFPKSLQFTTPVNVRRCDTVRHIQRALKFSTGYIEHNCEACFLKLKKQHKLRKYQTIVKSLHSDDIVFCVASDMEPGAGIDKGRIPTLQDISWVVQCLPQGMQCITCKEK
jgi:hypothetical protein